MVRFVLPRYSAYPDDSFDGPVAAIAGGLIGLIPGLLRAFLGTSEVIVTIMMNYIVLFAGNEIIRNFPKSLWSILNLVSQLGQMQVTA